MKQDIRDLEIVHKQEVTTAPQAAHQDTVGLACSRISEKLRAPRVPDYLNSLAVNTLDHPALMPETQHSPSCTLGATICRPELGNLTCVQLAKFMELWLISSTLFE